MSSEPTDAIGSAAPRGPQGTSIYEAPRMDIKDRGVSFNLVTRDMGAENVAVHLNVLRPGTEGPLHFHAQAEDVYIVLQGTGRIRLGDQDVIVGPDQVLFIPPGVRHSVANPGPGILKLIEIYSPPAHPHDFHLAE